jgi:glycogen debranching enzyme
MTELLADNEDMNSFPDPDRALASVRAAENQGVYASNGEMFRGMIFGRDSLEAALDLMDQDPRLVSEVIVKMVELQGSIANEVTEEEPGKVVHEWHRASEITPIEEWTRKYWGATDEELRVYYSVDATPLFANTIQEYVTRHGAGILDRRHQRHDGESVSVRDAYRAALGWIERKIASSDSGLLEYRHLHEGVLLNQSWKDSQTGMLHPDGSYNDFSQPIASLEVQGYAYDALMGSVDVLEAEASSAYAAQAEELRRQVLERLWMPEASYFAIGLDRDESGQSRPVKTLASNAGVLLSSGLFDSLPDDEREKYVSGVVSRLMSPEFLTDVGIRCRSLRHEDLTEYLGYSDYHGTWAVWPKESFDVATGLRRQGLPALARDLETRITNGFKVAGGYPELFYVNPDGQVLYRPVGAEAPDDPKAIAVTNIPDLDQTWSITADLAIRQRWQEPPAAPADFEQEVLGQIEPAPVLEDPRQLEALRRADPPFVLDRSTGLGQRGTSGLNPPDTPLP